MLIFKLFDMLTLLSQVGVTGFCMGGALTLAACALGLAVDAGSAFYGIPNSALCNVENIKVPVQLHFGNKDNAKGFSDVEAANKLEAQLQKANVTYDFNRYEDAGHAFTNKHSAAYDAQATALANERMVAFFKKYL